MKFSLEPVKYGVALSLLTILFGISLGVSFGLIESKIKGNLKADAQKVLSTVYKGNKAKAHKVTKKAWVYFKRAHLHAGGMGTTALAVCILLSMLSLSAWQALGLSIAVGLGSLGYSMFWLFAGMRAPSLGSTGAAKETLTWLAMPSTALYGLGIALTFVFVIIRLWISSSSADAS